MARPKSASLMVPSDAMRMFSDLMSLCKIPRECACVMAAKTPGRTVVATAASVKYPPLLNKLP
jgi:hypothetical protein